MKSLKRNVILILTLAITMLMGSLAGVLFAKSKKQVVAAENISLTVQKIKLFENEYNNKTYAAYYIYTNNPSPSGNTEGEGRIYNNVYTYDAKTDTYNGPYTITKYGEDTTDDIFERKIHLGEIDFDNLLNDNNPIFSGDFRKATAYDGTIVQENKETDNVFVLKNYELEQLENIDINECDAESMSIANSNLLVKEYMFVMFKPAQGSRLLSLTTNASLSGSIGFNDTKNISPLEKTTTERIISYCQLFDLNNTWILDNTQVGGLGEKLNEYDAQGKYTFNFVYNINDNGTVTTHNILNTSFYLLNEKYYRNSNNLEYNGNTIINNETTEPRLITTEKIPYSMFTNEEYPNEQNFFNFNNFETVDYNGNETILDENKHLQYPKVVYDASRYNLSFTKSMYGITTKVTTYLDRSNANYIKLVLTYDDGTIKVIRATENTPAYGSYLKIEGDGHYTQYIATIEFTDVGKYVLSFDFLLKDLALTFSQTEKTFAKQENWSVLHSDELSIYGYQAMHSVYGTGNVVTESELKNHENNLYADVTNTNQGVATIDLSEHETINLIGGNVEYPVSVYGSVPKTNQAPISFDYLATLKVSTNGSYYYKYERDTSKYNLINKQFELTSNTKFTENGLYIVCLKYTYQNYKYIVDEYEIINTLEVTFDKDNTYELIENKYVLTQDEQYSEDKTYYKKIAPEFGTQDKTHTQLFIFEIENAEPKVQFYRFEEIDTQKVDINTENTYELKNGNYVLTTDVKYDTNKTYYAKVELTTGGYTNSTVYIDWHDALQNPFDIKPKVTIYSQGFENNATATQLSFDASELENGVVSVSSSKKYIVKVEYGPCTPVYNTLLQRDEYVYSASVNSIFTIDKEEIGDAYNIVRFYEENFNDDGFKQPQKITNKNFAMVYGTIENQSDTEIRTSGKKRSEAKISVNYSFLPITPNYFETLNIQDKDYILDTDNLYVANGSAILSKNDNVAYNQAPLTSNFYENSTSLLTNDGIYVFMFTDEAGNTATRYIIKDTTTPLLFQRLTVENKEITAKLPSSASNKENMVNVDAQIIWGRYKAIKLDLDLPKQSVDDLVNELSNVAKYNIKEFEDNSYLIINMNTNISNPNNQTYDPLPQDRTTIYYKEKNILKAPEQQNIQLSTSPYNYLIIKTVDEEHKLITDNEHLFKIRTYDSLGNTFEGLIEITFDKSMLTATVSGLPSNNIQLINSNSSYETNGSTASNKLYSGNASNKQNLSLSWIEGSGDYTVVAVDCEFYPLTFEQYDDNGNLNYNYPYSYKAELFDLTKNTTKEVELVGLNSIESYVTKTRTQFINLQPDSRYDSLQSTVQGMYKVKRTYQNGENNDYWFYIDRNNIVSYDVNAKKYIGNDINILLGNVTEEDKYLFEGKDFLQDFIDDYIFITNKQPADLTVPVYKYYSSNIDSGLTETEEDGKFKSEIGVVRISTEIFKNDIVKPVSTSNSYSLTGNKNNDEVVLYKVRLYDDTDQASYYNEMNFNVAVNLYAPKAEFVDTKNNITLTEGTENYISRNNTNVKLAWTVDETNINAKIDETDIEILQTLENGRTITLYNKSFDTNIVTTNGNKKYIDLNQFANNINNKNCRIEITLKYQTKTADLYGNYFSSKKIIYFDYEKPQTNFNYLFENDTYLKAQNITKEQFENYESPISFDNYTFVVTSNFALKIPVRSAFWQYGLDSSVKTNPNDNDSSVWYRVYNKYTNDDSINQQSIVEGDDRYNDSSRAPNRLMFNAYTGYNLDNVVNDTYTKITTSIDKQIFEVGKYYEIIEKDCADNFRIYTIYVMPSDETGSKKIGYTKTEGLDENIPDYKAIISTQSSYEINNKKISLTSIDNLGDWFIINVIDGANNTNIINNLKVAPIQLDGYVTLSNALTTINANIIDSNGTGRLFIIKITSPTYANLTINYRTPGQKYELDAVLSSTSLSVTIDPFRYAGTYLKELTVTEVTKDGSQVLTVDSNGLDIWKNYDTTDAPRTYKFIFATNKVRNLWFEYTDNFGVIYRDNFILGIEQTPFEEMLKFNDLYVKNSNYTAKTISGISDFTKVAEYYTAANVTYEYQPEIYSIVSIDYIDENKNLINIEIDDSKINKNNSIWRISLFKLLSKDDIEDLQYFITFKDTSDKYYQFSVHNYKKVADVIFKDSSNFEHDFDEEVSISRPIYLLFNQYDTTASYPIKTTVTGTRTFVNSNNITVTENLGELKSEQTVIDKQGKYTITARSELGVEKIYQFEYIQSDAVYYSVKANVNGKLTTIYPSEVQYEYRNGLIDHYVSIYDANVYANQLKNLQVEVQEQYGQTNIYHIYSLNLNMQYDKYVAVTKVAQTSNILGENAFITTYKVVENEEVEDTQSIAFKYFKTNSRKVIFTIPAYNQNEYDIKSNILKVKVVYNNKDLGFASLIRDGDSASMELSIAGNYRLYVYDLAGNQHSFGGTPYFELSLINNFIYTLNGAKGIYNSIYNSAVHLGIEQTSNFVNDNNGNSYTITATLNGSPYTYTYSNGKYVFDSYGTYIVTLKGYLNKDANGNLIDEVTTQAKFTILNNNEARLMHEYIGLNGYEVTKIVKNNEDVTDMIKERLNSATITKFMISGLKDGIGGSGNYDITVTAFLDKIVGESQFTYSVWINNDNELLIIPSIAEGDSTTSKITLKLNLYQIYSKVGECKLKINGNTSISINNTTATNNVVTTITLTDNARYNVTLETIDGNTITSFVVTKVEPLNTVAIIVIVVTSVVVAGLTLTFILLRKRMRVR